MSVLLIAGSPSEPSRSAALLDDAHAHLVARGVRVERLSVRDVSAEALLRADFSHASVLAAVRQVAQAKAIVVATPIYKAAYAGALKALLDVLPQSALQGKAVLPLATGGSPGHLLALDYALRPVLQALGARLVLQGIYATDAQIKRSPDGVHIDADIAQRVAHGLGSLLQEAGIAHALPASTPLAANA
ncbi:FMN reductase (NADPH) [Comamonas serinivorans]|uniref:FMN reductase (NADPH) n=1 Tax=Comamonas serinivorans TaxID=1082851 RepID=A0A1Y0ERE0_9BURK|nr:NADPH-dependent FMN reductase [Comamonas serinivorans]ARU05990.1 FMN reductase (NADPH) [Comamonas serinivorans]